MAQNAINGWTAVPWILVVAGWWIANRQANDRERRKELRALLDLVISVANDIEALAIDYHTAVSRPDVSKEMNLLRRFARLTALLQTADRRGLHDYSISFWHRIGLSEFAWREPGPTAKANRALLNDYKRAVTLENFESQAFERQAADSEILKRVAAARDALIDNVETSFTCRFCGE